MNKIPCEINMEDTRKDVTVLVSIIVTKREFRLSTKADYYLNLVILVLFAD
jgi:hypothetical protein